MVEPKRIHTEDGRVKEMVDGRVKEMVEPK